MSYVIGKQAVQDIYNNLNRYGHETRALLTIQAYLNPQLNANINRHIKAGDFIGEQLGNSNYVEYKLVAAEPAVVLLGAAVVARVTLPIPFPHQILHVEVYHTDGAYAASTNPYQLTIQRRAGTIPNIAHMGVTLYDKTDITSSSKLIVFDEADSVCNRAEWSFDLYGTADELIYLVVTVKQLGGSD